MSDSIHSKLYTTEAAKSKEKVVEDLKVTDPPLDEAKAVLEEEEENDKDSEGDDRGRSS
tara:strand:+ start:108 stop:284 length:177 start_codon:yes stop_codon:yes gene_type:complete